MKLSDIRDARRRLQDAGIVEETPIERNSSIDRRAGATVHLKMEHLQRTGSFKPRGACNRLYRLRAEDTHVSRVIAASAGNHAQAVALAATEMGFDSTVVMPKNAPQAKIEATQSYGANIELRGQDFQTALEYATSIQTDDSTFVHAYDDPDIVAGQGTIGLEVLEQVPDVDAVVVPIGGGGLIGGISTVVGELAPDTEIIGVQAKGAETVRSSLRKGGPQRRDSVQTIADGIATGGLSPLTYDLIDEYVDTIVTVTDTEIADAIMYLLERTKQMIEGAGATSVAALFSDDADIRGETIVPILSGGNLSMMDLHTILNHGLRFRDQLVDLRIRIVDGPGKLGEISDTIAAHDVNIRSVSHDRSVADLGVDEAALNVRVETSGEKQTERIVTSLGSSGYDVEVLD